MFNYPCKNLLTLIYYPGKCFGYKIAIRFRHNIPILNVLLYINNNRLPPKGYTVTYIIYNLYLYIICINIYYISLTSAVYSFNCHYNSQLRGRVQYQRDTLHTQQACILLSCLLFEMRIEYIIYYILLSLIIACIYIIIIIIITRRRTSGERKYYYNILY